MLLVGFLGCFGIFVFLSFIYLFVYLFIIILFYIFILLKIDFFPSNIFLLWFPSL